MIDAAPKTSKAARFKEGELVTGRVLDVTAATHRITMSLKKALVSGKLPPFKSAAEAVPGARASGVVTGVTDYGLFVGFCGSLKGLVRAAEMGTGSQEGSGGEAAFTVGQVRRTDGSSHDYDLMGC